MTASATAIPARIDHVDALAASLRAAFDDDPIFRWLFRNAELRERFLPRFFAWEVRRHLDAGAVWTSEDAAGGSLWLPPDAGRPSPLEELRMMASVAPGLRRPVISLRGGRLIERHRPSERHWYLAVLGVDPAAQGGGLGSALLTAGLERPDADGLPVYLETAKERNIDFYRGHGFVLLGRFTLPDGPPVWRMQRPAGG